MSRIEGENLPELPQWLNELLPETSTPQLLAVTADNKLELIQPDGSARVFDTLKDAYNASRESDLDLNIAPEVAAREGEKDTFFLSFPSEDKRFSTMVMGYTDQDRIDSLKRSYGEFLEYAKSYASNPEDFVKAWRFLDTHPAFWTASDLKGHPFYWAQEGHANKLNVSVYRHEGETVIELETGSHVPPEYTTHYGDWRLEVAAETYELAIIELAKRVALTHNLDGTDVEGADEIFEKPNWVKDLEERLEEYKDLGEEDSTD